MELFSNKDEVCQLMDKLVIHSLELIEEDVTLKLHIEKLSELSIFSKFNFSLIPRC